MSDIQSESRHSSFYIFIFFSQQIHDESINIQQNASDEQQHLSKRHQTLHRINDAEKHVFKSITDAAR